MKNTRSLLGIFSILVVLGACGLSGVAEARIGGGRSSGYRGSRNFAPRTAPAQPYNAAPQNSQQSFSGNLNSPMGNSGGLMRGIMGGVAGGFLGSMLARNFGNAGTGVAGSGGGFGMLEMLLLAGVGYFLFRKFLQPRLAPANQASMSSFRPVAHSVPEAQDVSETLRRYDPSFDLVRFKEERMDDFLKIQSSWNTRNLAPVENLIASEIRETLEADIGALKRDRRINKLENIAVRSSDLVEGWQEGGKEYATLNFRAQLVDYTVDEDTQSVVHGDRNQPVKFDEEWTFVRNTHSPVSSTNPWKLSAISNS